MKKIVLSIAIVTLSFGALHAQENAEKDNSIKREHRKEKIHRIKAQADKLNLTAEQKEKFKSLNQDFRKQIADIKKQDKFTVAQQREKIASLRKEHREKRQSMLTAEQKATLKESNVQNKEKMKEWKKEKQMKIKEQLDLTNEQAGKLATSRNAAAEKVKALKEDKTLNAEAKKEKIKAIMQEQKAVREATLTPAQLEKLKAAKEKHKNKHKLKSEAKNE